MNAPLRKRPKLSVSLHPAVIDWLRREAESRHIDVSAVVTLLVNDAMQKDPAVVHQTVNGDGNRLHATVGQLDGQTSPKPRRRYTQEDLLKRKSITGGR